MPFLIIFSKKNPLAFLYNLFLVGLMMMLDEQILTDILSYRRDAGSIIEM